MPRTFGMAWQTSAEGKERARHIMEEAAQHEFRHRHPNTGDISLSWHFERGDPTPRYDEDGQEYTIPDRWLLLAEAEELS